MNPYEEILTHLQLNHFYPRKVVKVSKKKEEVIALEVECPSILFDTRIERLGEVLGEGWKLTSFPNEEFIKIEKA